MDIRTILDFIKNKGGIIAYTTIYTFLHSYVILMCIVLFAGIFLRIIMLEGTQISLILAILKAQENLIISTYVEYQDYTKRR